MRKIHLALAMGVAGVLLTACGGASGVTGAEAAPTLTIITPKNGDIVNQPFILRFKANVPIGPTDTGKDHVHVFADGRESDYTVVTSSPYTIKNLPAGTHRIGVTLEHADHSPAGATTEITVQIQNGATATATPEDDDSGYGGGY
jgi:hypothetical protein